MAIPYGSLADRRGRKAILGMCVLGMVLSQLIWAVIAWNWRRWDLRYVWASSAALLIGGGQSVAEAMVFAMIADVASEEKRYIETPSSLFYWSPFSQTKLLIINKGRIFPSRNLRRAPGRSHRTFHRVHNDKLLDLASHPCVSSHHDHRRPAHSHDPRDSRDESHFGPGEIPLASQHTDVLETC